MVRKRFLRLSACVKKILMEIGSTDAYPQAYHCYLGPNLVVIFDRNGIFHVVSSLCSCRYCNSLACEQNKHFLQCISLRHRPVALLFQSQIAIIATNTLLIHKYSLIVIVISLLNLFESKRTNIKSFLQSLGIILCCNVLR